MKTRIIYILVGLLSIGLSNTFSQSIQDFTIENNTGFVIYDVYVAYANEDEWGEDLLENDYLEDGESLKINFSGYDFEACSFDVMIGDLDGNYFMVTDVDLCTVATLTFNEEDRWVEEESQNSTDGESQSYSLQEILTSSAWNTTFGGQSYGSMKFYSNGEVVKSSEGMSDTKGTWKLNGNTLTIHFPDEGDAFDGIVEYVNGNINVNFMGIEWVYIKK